MYTSIKPDSDIESKHFFAHDDNRILDILEYAGYFVHYYRPFTGSFSFKKAQIVSVPLRLSPSTKSGKIIVETELTAPFASTTNILTSNDIISLGGTKSTQ